MCSLRLYFHELKGNLTEISSLFDLAVKDRGQVALRTVCLRLHSKQIFNVWHPGISDDILWMETEMYNLIQFKTSQTKPPAYCKESFTTHWWDLSVYYWEVHSSSAMTKVKLWHSIGPKGPSKHFTENVTVWQTPHTQKTRHYWGSLLSFFNCEFSSVCLADHKINSFTFILPICTSCRWFKMKVFLWSV